MTHRLTITLAVIAAACATLVGGAAADRDHHGQLFTFSGELLAAPGAGATSVSLQVETGNHAALRDMIGAAQDQVFTVGTDTEVLLWSNGMVHVGSLGDLQQGDYVSVNVRAPGGSSLQTVEQQAANSVSDHAAPHGGFPAWMFAGTVAGPQSGGTIALHVDSGNWKALHAMLGQPLDQSFTYDGGTIFLLWQGHVPTLIDPSQLKAGDRILVWVRAPRTDTLAQIEAIPAARVGDHEPAPAPEE